MIPELGHLLLILALGVSLLLGTLPLAGAQRGRADWMALARPLGGWMAAFVFGAFACLTVAFVRNDFSVLYVASNSNSALPLAYRVAGVWGGHEGSLLLWVTMLCGWTVAVSRGSRRLPQPFVARVLAVMGLVAAGFLLFMLFTSNPFDRLLPAAPDGRDLNPLLQDPGMVAHPPMLYMGYVGFSVAYAFAIAALLGGQLDATWARWTRPWTVAAWSCLTIGILPFDPAVHGKAQRGNHRLQLVKHRAGGRRDAGAGDQALGQLDWVQIDRVGHAGLRSKPCAARPPATGRRASRC